MKLFPIEDPVVGEQILKVQPVIEPYPDADWRQRLEYFSGRALTHTALNLEQRGRDGHLATLGQAVSPGVVIGLEAVAEVTARGVVIEIAAGLGVAASGEIVNINRNQQMLLDDIRVYAPAAMLEAAGESATAGKTYRLGDTLGNLRAAGQNLPEAMVLVLQPVAVEHFGQEPSTDPCDYDPTDEAFENWQWLDGCRVVLHAWNPELGFVPLAGDWRRNRIAHTIFDRERRLNEGQFFDWQSLGVPVALIGLNDKLQFEFIDRNSVVRRGGETLGNDVPITPAGNRFLWQAQFEQFNEQLVDWFLSDTSLDPTRIKASEQFRHLPPVGVLPKESMSPRQQEQRFFPLSYAVRAMAIPYEQLDLAIEESASLLPYDLNTPDRVEVLVPVPQSHYEPQLLVVEEIDPEFEQTIQRFSQLRDQWLGRRVNLRAKASALYHSMKGRPLLYRIDDPNAIDSLEQPAEFEEALLQDGDACQYLKGQSAPPGNWFQQSFDDTAWQSGPTAIGYGQANLATTLDDMQGSYVTVYLRHLFNLDALDETHRYTLRITTNGGFHAYLNDRFLLADNVTRPFHDASARQSQTLETRHYELGELRGRLLEGENLLAILAHNASLNEGEFSISVSLLDTEDRYGTTQTQIDGRVEYSVDELEAVRDYLGDIGFLTASEVNKLDEEGIEEYIQFLQRKIDKADDRVEFGFLRLRTDIYRVRQMVLGNEAGTKLATSPALAEIAKSESAVATKDELSDFYTRLKEAKPVVGGGVNINATLNANVTSDTVAMRASATRETSSVTANNLFISGELSGGGTNELLRGATRDKTVTERIIGDRGEKITLDQETEPMVDLDAGGRRKTSLADLFNTADLEYATAEEVGEQNPLIGNTQSFNNVTVGERLEESSANISLMSGIAAKGEMLANLLETDVDDDGINLDGLDVPGFKEQQEVNGQTVWVNVTKTFTQIRDEGLVDRVLEGQHDPVEDDDEAAYFSSGIRALENVVGVLRLVEGRVHAYRRAVTRCKSALSVIQVELRKSDQRLRTIGDELAEARHDVSVAQSLKAEELARIDVLNTQRDKILATQVPFLLYRRPRIIDPREDLPLHYLNPDLSETPLPLCDLSEVEAPEALDAMLDLVRDAPLKWFSAVNLILPKLSRLADLHVTLSGAKKRATSRITMHPYMKQNFQVSDKLLQGLGAALSQSSRRIQLERKKTGLIDLAAFQRLGWKESIRRVPEVVSLGDLIDANHGRLVASRRAADELARITQVTICLYVNFSEVSASIRLDWAERLSQYDRSISLRNLYALPRFGELDYTERYNMQRLVDWLYSRIASNYSDAVDLINDMIRIILLAASHAPVNQLIAGHLPEPVTVKVGSRINVITDLSRVRIGMAISLKSGGATLVRGRVADISGGQVSAEVLTTVGTSVQLAAGTRVQIGERLGMNFTL